ncbi:ERCC4 domain protein, partial [Toxoplasma gondii p89]
TGREQPDLSRIESIDRQFLLEAEDSDASQRAMNMRPLSSFQSTFSMLGSKKTRVRAESESDQVAVCASVKEPPSLGGGKDREDDVHPTSPAKKTRERQNTPATAAQNIVCVEDSTDNLNRRAAATGLQLVGVHTPERSRPERGPSSGTESRVSGKSRQMRLAVCPVAATEKTQTKTDSSSSPACKNNRNPTGTRLAVQPLQLTEEQEAAKVREDTVGVRPASSATNTAAVDFLRRLPGVTSKNINLIVSRVPNLADLAAMSEKEMIDLLGA